jgi:hypothetical protein
MIPARSLTLSVRERCSARRRTATRAGRITRFVEYFDSVRLVTGCGGTVEAPAFG